MRWRSGQRIAAVFFVPFAAVAGGGLAVVQALEQLAESRSAAAVFRLLGEIGEGRGEASSELALFAAGGGAEHLYAHVSAAERVERDALSLRALAAGDADRGPLAEQLYSAVAKELASARRLAAAPRDRAPLLAVQALRSASARETDSTVQAASANLKRVEQQRLDRSFPRFWPGSEGRLRRVWAGTLLAAGLIGLASVAVSEYFRRPVRHLLEATQKIRDGALETRVRVRSRDELGRLAAAFNEMADALQRAHTGLQQSTQILRSVLDSMADGVIVADRSGKVMLMNRAAREILGAHPSGAEPPLERLGETPLAAAIQGQVVRDVELVIGAEGASPERCMIAAATPVMDAQGLWGGVMVMTDITERKQAQQALKESEEQFRSFIETTSEWIWSADQDARLTYSNPALLPILGYFPGQVAGTDLRELVHPQDRARFSQVLAGLGAEQARATGVVARWRHEHGTERWLESNIVPIVDAGGAVAGYRGTARDITLRQYAESALQKLNFELHRRIEQLNAVNKELETFGYSVSHDLRAPLRAIDGFSQALLEDYLDRLDAEGQDYLRRVRAASQRMAQLIDDLLNLSRVARNELSCKPVDMSELARSVIAVLRERDPGRSIEVRIAEDMQAQADARLLRIVFENLLGNAWKFTRHASPARIEVDKVACDGQTAYMVRDNGVGFDMAYANKLFGAFQRLHGSDEFEGTGIGLATVQRIIHRHGGRVWAEAAVGKGAAFYFTLG